MHGLAPDYLTCVVVCYAPIRALRLACDTTLLKVTMSNNTIGQTNFAAPECGITCEMCAICRNINGFTYFACTTCIDTNTSFRI